MVRSYLRYKPEFTFGVVASPSSNVILDASQQYAIAASLSQVIVWDLATQELMHRWIDPENTAEVTIISPSPGSASEFAVGYGDGSVRLWDLSGNHKVTFRGHTSPICALHWNEFTPLLASGSRNGDIVIWDLSSEAGQARLKGHKASITQLAFISSSILISSGKDALIKAWDISLQHCFQTVVQEQPIGSFVVLADHDLLVAGRVFINYSLGAVDSYFRIFSIDRGLVQFSSTSSTLLNELEKVQRTAPGKERVASMEIVDGVLVVHSFDKSVELYRVLDREALAKKAARRKKRNPEKDLDSCVSLADTFQFISTLRSSYKIRSICLGKLVKKGGLSSMRILISTFSNSIQVWSLFKAVDEKKQISLELQHALENYGHRASIAWIASSNPSGLIASGCSDSAKLWNLSTGKSIATFLASDLGNASPTAGCFLSKEWLLLGDKAGNLFILNTVTNEIVGKFSVNGGGIISLRSKNDILLSATTSRVHIWNIGRTTQGIPTLIPLSNEGIEKAPDSVVAIALSPDTKFIAISLIDCTVHIYYRDSMKFFLSLYGHKLPVIALDFSSDSSLIATGSADKNLKIWGLDFGDCHRSIFAHSDALTDVVWVPKTHLLFTASKDNTIKYWDGDSFELITTLKGHHSEISSMAISTEGKFLMTAGRFDRSCFIWSRSDEQVFIDDERERETDERLVADLISEDTLAGDAVSKLTLEGNNPLTENNGETTGLGNETRILPSTVKSLQSIKSSEKLYELITLASSEIAEIQQLTETSNIGSFQRKPLLHAYALGLDPSSTMEHGSSMLPAHKIVLEVVRKIPAADIEQSILMLPLSTLISFIKIIEKWIVVNEDDNMVSSFGSALLGSKLIFLIISLHSSQLIHCQEIYSSLYHIRECGFKQLKFERELVGKNMALMCSLASQIRQHPDFSDLDSHCSQKRSNGF